MVCPRPKSCDMPRALMSIAPILCCDETKNRGTYTRVRLAIIIYIYLFFSRASLVAQLVKNPPAIQETLVRSLGWEDPLEKGKATHSTILAWRIPWTVWSMGLQRVRYDRDFHFHFFSKHAYIPTLQAFVLLTKKRCT